MTERRDGWKQGRMGKKNAVAVEKCLEARLGKGIERWMGEGEMKAGIGRSIGPV